MLGGSPQSQSVYGPRDRAPNMGVHFSTRAAGAATAELVVEVVSAPAAGSSIKKWLVAPIEQEMTVTSDRYKTGYPSSSHELQAEGWDHSAKNKILESNRARFLR